MAHAGSAFLAYLCGLLWRLSARFGKHSLVGAGFYFLAVLFATNAGDFSSSAIILASTLAFVAPFLLWSRFKRALNWFFGPLMQPPREGYR